jgi:DNA-binding LacI/PurR family transcriptional regulator
MARSKSAKTAKPIPYYEQVANVLRAQITNAQSHQAIRLSPERELCAIHDVSRITISKALDVLEQEGLIQRTPGRGTLTVPKAIERWKRLRQGRIVHVLSSWQRLTDIPSSYYGQVYQGILASVEGAGFRLSTQELHSYRTNMALNPILPDPQTTLGVIFIGLMNEPTVELYTQAGYPVVCVDYWTTSPQADAIVVDCYGEGQTAVDFLLRQGHNHMFYLGNLLAFGSSVEKESDAALVLAGIQRGLDLAALPPLPPERIRFCNFQQPHVEETAKWFLSLRPRPTAGIVFDSSTCAALAHYLGEQNVRCPEDVSLVTKLWEGAPSDFTCLRSNAYALGELAVGTLLDRVAERHSGGVRVALASRLDRGRTTRQILPPLEPESTPPRPRK